MDYHYSEFTSEFYTDFKAFHELMAQKINKILLISSLYDAYIMEEEGSLASKILNEYSGLNLSHPPKIIRTDSAKQGLRLLQNESFDMVITMPHLDEMDAFSLGLEIKSICPTIPIILLTHTMRSIVPFLETSDCRGIDKYYVWTGNAELLLALIKNAEDQLNVKHDTELAQVRVLLMVEDSPIYISKLLPFLYKEIVKQTQAVLECGLNEDHRLLMMRGRPKILVAESYEEALSLFDRYRAYLIGVISDARFPKNGKKTDHAGIDLLKMMKQELPNLPVLLMSSESENKALAMDIPAIFLNKNASTLLSDLHNFFLNQLGFGDFVFKMPNGRTISRASDLRELEKELSKIPEESLIYHAENKHFSSWIMARSEILLATKFRNAKIANFNSIQDMRQFLISNILALRKCRQRGVVAQFNPKQFDADIMEFVKIGNGSLGGKARGISFMSRLLHQHSDIHEKYPMVNIQLPNTLVICSDWFEYFIDHNHLAYFKETDVSDQVIMGYFLQGKVPEFLVTKLESFLSEVHYPLSVRSSSLLEDAQFQPYAGLYSTYMIPNNDPKLSVRVKQLLSAIKLVYASTYFEGPKAYTKNISCQPHDESMSVIIQQVCGYAYGNFYYPSISGVAQSHNFYPISRMTCEDGIAHIALGFGKTVVEGEKTLRFSPKHPNLLPQFSTVEDMLKNSQRYFYALQIKEYENDLNFSNYSNLVKLEISQAIEDYPIKYLSSTYIPEEQRIRDSGYIPGPKVLSFASILKYNQFPLPGLLSDLLELGRKSIGCPVEIEFAVNITENKSRHDFYLLQIRPMVAHLDNIQVQITESDICTSFCYSAQALGNGFYHTISDIVFVKPESFDVAKTIHIAKEIGTINGKLIKERKPYLLIGPGRWGSSDRWLGIPVQWQDISQAGAIIELRNNQLKADPSQGSHFFQNITSLGIPYITITENTSEFLHWDWLNALQFEQETEFIRHVHLPHTIMIKIDGRKSNCIMRYCDANSENHNPRSFEIS